MYALIDQNNKVADVQENQFPVHPALQWVSCDGSVKIGFLYDFDNQSFSDPSIKPLTLNDYSLAIKDLLDSKASEKNYFSEDSIVSYAHSTNQTWAQEAADFIAWRDQCWQYAIDVQARVEGGEIEPPSVGNFIANAPVLNWT